MITFLRPRSRARKLLFEHIPKCGGTATRGYFERHYAGSRTYQVYGRRPEECAGFKRLPVARRHAYDLVIGHGAHELLDWTAPGTIAATVLREPVDRILSHYYYVREKPEHYLHAAVAGGDLSPGAYVAAGLSDELRNHMVCRFLGVRPEAAERDPARAVEGAWDVLNHRYRIVGIAERLDAAMDAIRTAVGFDGRFSGERTNCTRSRRPATQLSAEDRRLIEQHNALDIELYRRVAAAAPR
ncbi:MAG: hypothetical protein EBS56_07610 [Planctomycetia bacterium]|nr:hypothetical protein [Planctomycetia bacterium]